MAQSASEKEQYTKSHAGTVTKDIAQQYLQEIADKAGGGEAGLQAVKMELNRLESSKYAQDTFREMSDIGGGLNIKTQINDASMQIQQASQNIGGGQTIQTRENNDNQVREQSMLNESYVRGHQQPQANKGRTEH